MSRSCQQGARAHSHGNFLNETLCACTVAMFDYSWMDLMRYRCSDTGAACAVLELAPVRELARTSSTAERWTCTRV